MDHVAGEFIDAIAEIGVGFVQLFDLGARVNDSRMVASTEMTADLFETVAGQASCQVHADLPGQGNGLTAFFALQIGDADIEMVADHPDDAR